MVAAKPSPGKQTLEDPLAMVMQNPTRIGFRVLRNTACGSELLKQASLENARLLAVRDGEESLAGSEEFFKGIFGIEAVATLLEKGESNDSSVLDPADVLLQSCRNERDHRCLDMISFHFTYSLQADLDSRRLATECVQASG